MSQGPGPALMSSIRDFVSTGVPPIIAPGAATAAVMPGMPAGGELSRVMAQSPYNVARNAGLSSPQNAIQSASGDCTSCGDYPTYPSTANVMFRDIVPAPGLPKWLIVIGVLGLIVGGYFVVRYISRRS